jgi:hypothetical protein
VTLLNGKPIGDPAASGGQTAPQHPVASAQSQQVGLVVGIMSLVFAFAVPLAGAILGGVAVAQARRGGYANPLALAGLILGTVFTVLIVAVVVASVVLGVGVFTQLVGACQDSPEGTIWGIPYTCN